MVERLSRHVKVDPDGRPASLICYILISCWNSRNRAQVCKSCPGHSLYTDWPRHNWKPNHRSYFIIPSKLNIDGRCHGRWTWIDDEYKTYLGEGIWQLGKHISLSAVSHPPARTVARPPDQSILVFISTISVRRSPSTCLPHPFHPRPGHQQLELQPELYLSGHVSHCLLFFVRLPLGFCCLNTSI